MQGYFKIADRSITVISACIVNRLKFEKKKMLRFDYEMNHLELF